MPSRPGPSDVFAARKAIAGVGVIYYVLTLVRAKLRESGWKRGALASWLSRISRIAYATPADGSRPASHSSTNGGWTPRAGRR